MNPFLSQTMFVEWNKLELKIATLRAQKAEQELIDIYQQEQDLIFCALDESTAREMLDLRKLRDLENRLKMLPRQFCPYHDEREEMAWTGEVSYTQDSTGRTTGMYRVIVCPRCKNTEMEGVRTC